jgi:hypothetical protein
MRTIGLVSIIATVFLGGCANYVWIKDGATQEEFAHDRYDCLREAQQQETTTSVGLFGIDDETESNANAGLYQACMNARGYTLQRQQTSN